MGVELFSYVNTFVGVMLYRDFVHRNLGQQSEKYIFTTIATNLAIFNKSLDNTVLNVLNLSHNAFFSCTLEKTLSLTLILW